MGVEITKFKFFGSLKNDMEPHTKEVYNHYFFLVTKWKGRITKRKMTEIKTFKWIGKEELEKLKFARNIRDILRRALS